MKIVGVVGGIGSGKSFLCSLFMKNDAAVFDFDNAARNVLTQNEEVVTNVKELFGDDIYLGKHRSFDQSYVLDKEKLGKIIFSDESKRTQLESLIRPELMKRFYEFCYEQEYKYNKSFIIAESATMIKTGLYKIFDEIIVVSADYNKRKEMVTKHRGISDDDFDSRVLVQLSVDETMDILKENNIIHRLFFNSFNNETEEFVLDFIKSNI